MICRTCCSLLTAGLVLCTISAVSIGAGESPYSKVASGKAADGEKAKVYTNSDLKKRYGVAKEADKEEAGAEAKPTAPPAGSELSPLEWLQQRQAARAQHAVQLKEATAAVEAARAKLTGLQTQLAATRSPFAPRPKLSDEEKEKRLNSSETAAQRNERTKTLVEQAREELGLAEAELVKLQAARP